MALLGSRQAWVYRFFLELALSSFMFWLPLTRPALYMVNLYLLINIIYKS